MVCLPEMNHTNKIVLGLSPLYSDGFSPSMGLPIVYFKGSQIDFSKLLCISVPEGSFNLWEQCRPMNVALCCISSGFSLFAKVLF